MKKNNFILLFLLVLLMGTICIACSKEHEEILNSPVPKGGSVVNDYLGEITDVEGRLLRFFRLNAWYVQTANRDTYILFLKGRDHEYNMKEELKDLLKEGTTVKVSGKIYSISEYYGDGVPELKELIGQNKAFGMVAPDITIEKVSE